MKIGSPADKPPVAPATTGRAAPAEGAKTSATPGATDTSTTVEISNTAATLTVDQTVAMCDDLLEAHREVLPPALLR